MIEYTVRVYGDRTEWFLNGKLHREDGPAREWADGYKSWYLNGKLHREDGPAVEYADGSKSWCLNGEELTEIEFNQRTQVKELTIAELEAIIGYKIKVIGNKMIEYTVRVYDYGTEWYLNGKFHREDGPAVEYADGYKSWYLNGKLHREGGPAIEYADGSKFWCLNGVLHREDGPAIEWANGKEWYLNGSWLSEKEFIQRTQVKCLTINEIEAIIGHKIKVIGESKVRDDK